MPDEDDHSLPGRPHVIRWRTAQLATIEQDDVVLAALRVAYETVPYVTILSEPPTTEGKALLFRSLVWALEEYERRLASYGVVA
jgi:hypothetical protein